MERRLLLISFSQEYLNTGALQKNVYRLGLPFFSLFFIKLTVKEQCDNKWVFNILYDTAFFSYLLSLYFPSRYFYTVTLVVVNTALKYTVDCDMRGIQFDYDVRVCNLAQLDGIDLAAILGNLMDNAVSAAEQSAGKTISLSTVHRNSYSVIVVSNSCDVPPKQSGNRLLSTKSDSSLHGFGLKSVKKTICKYQGDFEWGYDADKKSFTITVMIADG